MYIHHNLIDQFQGYFFGMELTMLIEHVHMSA